MTTKHVYRVGASTEDIRPEIDCTLNKANVDWHRIAQIINGDRPVRDYVVPRINLPADDAAAWDYYSCGGTHGFMSSRAYAVLSPYATYCLQFLDAYINNAKYYLLRGVCTIDCLDRDQSELVEFPDGSGAIMEIEKYVFRKDTLSDPCLFLIAEDPGRMFGTDKIEQIIRSNGLRGFRMVDVELVGTIP
jgi:hypothetical protein